MPAIITRPLKDDPISNFQVVDLPEVLIKGQCGCCGTYLPELYLGFGWNLETMVKLYQATYPQAVRIMVDIAMPIKHG